MKKIYFLTIFCLLLNTIILSAQSKNPNAKAQMDMTITAEEYITTHTKVVTLNNAKASEIAAVIKKALSKYGDVQINDDLNLVIITDIPEMIDNLVDTAKRLDIKNFKSADGVQTEVIILKYVHPDTMKDYIQHKLSPSGFLKSDPEQNALIITEVPSRINEILAIIKKIDVPVKQILIMAKIIEVNIEDYRNIGIDWTKLLDFTSINASWRPLNNTSDKYSRKTDSKTLTDTSSTYRNDTYDYDNNRDYSTYSLSMNLSINQLSSIINLMIQDGNGNVLSTPKIVTKNNKKASIYSGEKIPYNYHLNYESVANTGVNLEVLPHINADKSISMDIYASVNSLSGYTPQALPIVFTRNIDTHVTINDGDTFILGGLRKTIKVESIKRFPVLGYIPLIKYLFSKKISVDLTREVVIFITPKIIENNKSIDLNTMKKFDGTQTEDKKSKKKKKKK